MKRITIACVFLFAAAAVLPAQGRFQHGAGRGEFGPEFGMMMAGPGSRIPVAGSPYSGTQTSETQQALAGGNQITRQSQSKVYRDSQGRVRIEHTNAEQGTQAAHTLISISDPVAGVDYILNPATKIATKVPIHIPAGAERLARARRGPEASQSQTEDLGTQTVNGLAATGTRVTTTIPAGAIGNQQPIISVRETWISTALKVPVSIKTTDPRFGSATMQLTNVTQVEPDAALFQVPADYTVKDRPLGAGEMMRRGGPRN